MTEAERRRKSFGIGYLLSLAGSPLPIAQRAPIAYLYNGVQLPALPEWDKETYPYAYIAETSRHIISAIFTPVKLVVEPKEGATYYIIPFENGESVVYLSSHYTESGGWGDISENTTDAFYVAPIWCNTDLYFTDGALHVASNEPIPVYK